MMKTKKALSKNLFKSLFTTKYLFIVSILTVWFIIFTLTVLAYYFFEVLQESFSFFPNLQIQTGIGIVYLLTLLLGVVIVLGAIGVIFLLGFCKLVESIKSSIIDSTIQMDNGETSNHSFANHL